MSGVKIRQSVALKRAEGRQGRGRGMARPYLHG